MIWFLIILSFGLRLLAINQSLWLDEAIGAIAASDYSYTGIIFDFLQSDNHPALYYLTLKGWSSLFGFTDVAMRLLSVTFGVLTVYVTYLIAKHFDKTRHKAFANLTGLFLATSPLHIYYSQEVRMYAMAAFFAALAFYAFIKTLGKKVNPRYWFIFSLSLPLLLFTDYAPIFMIPVFWFLGFIKKRKYVWWRSFLLSHLPLAVLAIWWQPMFSLQVKKGEWLLATLPAWRKVAGGANLRQIGILWAKFVLGRISFVSKKLYFSLVGFASLPFLYALVNTLREKKKSIFFWSWFLIPLILGFISSFNFPAFNYFRFIYVLPAFYLLVSFGVLSVKKDSLKVFVGILIILVNILGIYIYISDERQQREKWGEAVSFVEENAKEEEIVVFGYPEPFAPYRWYESGKVKSFGVTNSIALDEEITKENTKDVVKESSGVYYFEYLRELSDPNRVVEQTILESGYELEKTYDFTGVGFVKYFTRR